jgi:hypothetical protein
MAVLSIHLQEGFDDDEVVVRMNGAESARRQHLTTKRLLGYADIVELRKPAGSEIRLEVSLPDRSLVGSATVPAMGDSFIAANVVGGRLELAVRDRPFAYA